MNGLSEQKCVRQLNGHPHFPLGGSACFRLEGLGWSPRQVSLTICAGDPAPRFLGCPCSSGILRRLSSSPVRRRVRSETSEGGGTAWCGLGAWRPGRRTPCCPRRLGTAGGLRERPQGEGGRPALLPERELVHALVHLGGLVLLRLRVADGHTNTADRGVVGPVQSPAHRDGHGSHVGDLEALDRVGSWETRGLLIRGKAGAQDNRWGSGRVRGAQAAQA